MMERLNNLHTHCGDFYNADAVEKQLARMESQINKTITKLTKVRNDLKAIRYLKKEGNNG